MSYTLVYYHNVVVLERVEIEVESLDDLELFIDPDDENYDEERYGDLYFREVSMDNDGPLELKEIVCGPDDPVPEDVEAEVEVTREDREWLARIAS